MERFEFDKFYEIGTLLIIDDIIVEVSRFTACTNCVIHKTDHCCDAMCETSDRKDGKSVLFKHHGIAAGCMEE